MIVSSAKFQRTPLSCFKAKQAPGFRLATAPTVSKWKRRFEQADLEGLGRPEFEAKAAGIIGLYLSPPQHALEWVKSSNVPDAGPVE